MISSVDNREKCRQQLGLHASRHPRDQADERDP